MRVSNADTQYLDIVERILKDGYYSNNRTGIPTYKLPHQMMQFDLEKEFPILTTKFVAFKTAIKEILWIWQLQSNDVRELQKMNCHVWDEWMRPDGTIGKAYGYQIRKYKQVDTLLEQLTKDPQNRRMIVSLWNIEDLPDMALQPCAYQTLWDVSDGRLNCMLIQRSGDMGLGVPFNMAQYAALVYMIAQVTNLRPGLFTHVINNAHVYENHVEAMRTQLARRDQAFAAPVEDGMMLPAAARPPLQSFLEGPSTVFWVAVVACTVLIRPSTTPKLSLITFTSGARQLVVQDALETTSISLVYLSSFTPTTKVGVSLSFAGAEITTFLAPALM